MTLVPPFSRLEEIEQSAARWRAAMDEQPDRQAWSIHRENIVNVLASIHELITSLRSALSENAELLRFAGTALEESRVIDIGDWDGGSIQDAMVECGLLQPFTVEARCGEYCECDVGCTCYRPTELAARALSAFRAAATPSPSPKDADT